MLNGVTGFCRNKASFGVVHLRSKPYKEVREAFPNADIYKASNCSTENYDVDRYAIATEGESQKEVLESLQAQDNLIHRNYMVVII